MGVVAGFYTRGSGQAGDGVVRKQSEALRTPLGFAHPRQLA